ncbi:MAG: TonB-dependent receptor [Bacteroidia bacterium]|nr:TonB-dependent receptor [Bacteroidia bacterium]
MERTELTPDRKALDINLNSTIYGSFAEIGGGQEVARFFFRAGGASGTIAKTMSAYDMVFSNSVYGQSESGRYVSKERLIKMLDIEFAGMVNLLEGKKDISTRFFVFANTVATLNFRKDNESHGWIGVKFQLTPYSLPNEILVHVRLLENDSFLQQQTLGIFGVNLIYGCYHLHETPNQFLLSLLDSLSPERIEVNMVEMKGPELAYVDNRLLSVQLVKNNMTHAAMFDRYGQVQQPADMLYKRNVLVLRGIFRPITYTGFDMLKTSYGLFKRDESFEKENTFAFCEITLNSLLEKGNFDERDFLERVDILNGMGQNVMITSFREFYKLVFHLSHYKVTNLRIIMGVMTFLKVMDSNYYSDLNGGILEAFGKLFPENMKLYLYPTIDNNTGTILNSSNIPVPDEIRYLFYHLLLNRKILDIKNAKPERLHIQSAEVRKMICDKDPAWEELVPRYVSRIIKEKNLFRNECK